MGVNIAALHLSIADIQFRSAESKHTNTMVPIINFTIRNFGTGKFEG